MKGLFIPEITEEMFRNGCLEGIEALMAEGELYDIDYTAWIPCSERLPENLEPVNITWVNRNPKSYYEEIKDKPQTATGHYYKGRWYWYSSTCQDYLKKYGRCYIDEIDKDIEVTAWMPLPEPYNPIDRAIKLIEKQSIPYLMHKEMDIPISECQKAYDVAIDYLRKQGKLKG